MKELKYSTLNKIKTCQLRIFEAEDDDYPNRRKVRANERVIFNLIKNYSKEEQRELLENILWHNDNCKKDLEELGWTLVKEEDEE